MGIPKEIYDLVADSDRHVFLHTMPVKCRVNPCKQPVKVMYSEDIEGTVFYHFFCEEHDLIYTQCRDLVRMGMQRDE